MSSSSPEARRTRSARSPLPILPLVAVALVTACSGDGDPAGTLGVDEAPADVVAAGAALREGIIGDPVDELVVQVLDAGHRGVPGVPVTFAVRSGGGSLSHATAVTDGEGLARSVWTLGPDVGVQAVSAGVAGIGETLFQAQAAAGETLSMAGGNNQTGAAGTALPVALAVRVIDGVGRPVAGRSVSWSVTAGDGNVQAITGTTNADGFAEAIWTLGIRLGENRAQARVGFGTVEFHAQAIPGPAAVVTVLPSTAAFLVGESRDFTASAVDRLGHGVPNPVFQWSSSNNGVLTVNSIGKATGVGGGSAQVRATTGGVTGAAQVTVTDPTPVPPPDPTAVTVASVVSVGQTTVTIQWTEVDDGTGNGANYAVRFATPTIDWATAAASELLVTPTGIGNTRQVTITGLAPATQYQFQIEPYRGVRNAADVRGPRSPVLPATTDAVPPAVVSIDVSPNPINFTALGQTQQITATPRDGGGNAVAEPVTYQSLTPGVATVSATGLVTAVAVGTATIQVTATCCAVTATVTVNVNQVAATVTVAPASFTIQVAAQQALTATVRDANNNVITGAPVTWSSSNTAFATVSAAGVVTGVAAGNAQIRATSGAAVGTSNATIIAAPPPPPPPPPSFETLTIRPFSTKAATDGDRGTGSFPNKTGGSEGWDGVESRFNTYTIVNDPSAPESPPNVMRILYQTGLPQANGPGVMQTQSFTGPAHGFKFNTQIQTRTRLKLGTNYFVGGVSNKIFFHRTNAAGKRPEPFLALFDAGGGTTFRLAANFQGTADDARGFLFASAPANALARDRWYEIQTFAQLNSAFGVADGIFRVWVDGVLVLEVLDVQYRNNNTPIFWDTIHFSPTFGGGRTVPSVPFDFDFFIDHMVIQAGNP